MSDEVKPRELEIDGHFILIDEEDYPIVSRFSWHIKPNRNTFYALTNVRIGGRQTQVSMHRLIMGLPSSEIDHKNRNGLDNRKSNLRACTKKQNSYNRVRSNKFGFRGVYKPKNSSRYAIQIQKDGKKYHKRGFAAAEEAARAYDLLNKELHGEFGIRNFED